VIELLAPARAAELRAARLTYPEVGRTAGSHPAGYRSFSHSTTLPPTVDFNAAARDLLGWQVHERAGLRVRASAATVEQDAVVRLSFFGVGAPCRVVYVIDEHRRQGFAYGTLPGHPESGEEAFVLERGDGAITFTISAFSRPATILSRLAAPLARVLQDTMTRRYLNAVS
jgi:uncharacterized protein (UPF0548 family)